MFFLRGGPPGPPRTPSKVGGRHRHRKRLGPCFDEIAPDNWIFRSFYRTISLQYSKIIIPIETSSANNINSELKVDIEIGSENISDQYLASSNYIDGLPYGYIREGDTELEINIGNLIQYYVINDDVPFDSFILKNNSKSNNFNSLYLNKNNSYIHLVVQK